MGPDETLQGSRGGGGAALPRAHHGLLARLGARPLHPLRVAGRDHPRGHHAQARRLRRHGRRGRGAHHLDPGVAGQRAQLGLPLLLAARRLLRRERAQPPERHAHDGALPRLHHQRGGRAARATCSPSTASAAAPSSRKPWSTRCPATAAWGRSASATRPSCRCRTTSTARRSSRPRTPSSTGGSPAVGNDGPLPPPRGPGRAGRGSSTRAPDAGLWELRGSAHVHTFSSVMCWVACDRLAKIARRLGLAEPAAPLARGGRPHPRRDRRARVVGEARQLRGHLRGRPARREPAPAGRAGLPARGRSRASPAPSPPSSASCAAATSSSATRSPTISARPRTPSWCAPSGTSTRWPRWAGATRRARSSRRRSRGATRLGLLSEDVNPATGELWGNFPQTYSMVGLINSATRLSIPWDQAF